MSEPNIKRASLADIKQMRERGELFHDANTPEGGEDLGPDFWATAEVQAVKRPRSVHLRLDPEVFEYFFNETHGKGHLTRMQNVLRSYVSAKQRRTR